MKTRASKQIDKQQIETLVRERKTVTAQSAIQRWLKSHNDIDSRIQACDWFRRLGDLGRAYRVVVPKEFKLKKANLSATEVRQYLWSARILNLMGASYYALQIGQQISDSKARSHDSEECRILGNIYLSNCAFKNAFRQFKASNSAEDSDPKSYVSRLGRIGLCDSLAGLGKYEQALRELKKIVVNEDESLLRGILLQAEGEYLARDRKYKLALQVCERAIGYFSKDDVSPDFAFMMKWMGVAKIASGSKTEGMRFLDRAIQLLKKPTNRPEMWLDCIYWKESMGVATLEERETLAHYPGQPDYYLNRYTPVHHSSHSTVSAELQIYPARGEWRWKKESKSYLSKEIELASWVRLSHPHGLPLYRAFTLLWPEEVNSFLQLGDRVHQLLKRLREIYDLDIFMLEKSLFMSDGGARRIGVETSQDVTPLAFSKSRQIRRSELAEFYSLGSTQVHHLIARWTGEGLASTYKQGRETWIEWRG